MSFMSALAPCICCHRVFSFNPYLVPSSTALTGTREPICESCMTQINNKRADMGLEPFDILPGAYEEVETGC